MSEECVVNLDNIMTIPKSVINERIISLSHSKMVLVDKDILFALDLDQPS